MAQGTYTLDPLTFTPDSACNRDSFSFDGTVLSGTSYAYCGDGDVYSYEVAIDTTGSAPSAAS